MKKCVFKVVVCSVAVFSASSSTAADQRNFSPTTGGVYPSTPYNWATPGNWETLVPAGAKTDLAGFIATTGDLMIEMPSPLTIGALEHTGTGQLYLLGDRLTIDCTGWTGSYGSPNPLLAGRLTSNVRIYANVTAAKISGLWEIAGDMNVDTEVTSSTGGQWWRGDWYANSASESRAGAFDLAYVNNSSSSMGFIAGGGCDAHVSEGWSMTEGSAFLKCSGVSIESVVPGCGVSGEGIPDGAFVRRIFPDHNLIELSLSARNTNPSATLEFGAILPTTTGRIAKLQAAGSSDRRFEAYAANEKGLFVLTIDRLMCSASRTATFDGHETPARLTVKRSDDVKGAVVFANSTDLTFPQATSGMAGIAYANDVRFSGNKAHIAVEAGVTAAYSNVTAMADGLALTKDGPGVLQLSLADSLTSVNSLLVIKDGVLELAPKSPTTIFSAVSVAAGRTLRVTTGRAAVTELGAGATLIAEAGAKIDLTAFAEVPAGVKLRGAGSFVVQSLDSVKGVDKGSDTSISLPNEGSMRDIKPTGMIVPAVVGEPAFWVDAAKNVTTIISNGVENCVLSWLDCRAESGSDDYREFYATNDFSQLRGTGNGTAPSRLTTCAGFPALDHSGLTAFGKGLGETNARWVYSGMVWNKPIVNIYAVFSVTYQPSGGGRGQSILGVTRRFNGVRNAKGECDFARGVDASTDGGGATSPDKSYIFSASASDCVKNGWIYAEGIRKSWNSNSYRADSIEIVESHPLAPGGKADAFAMQDGNAANPCLMSGMQYQLETIIYTNELTQTERAQVYAYLTKKYSGEDYDVKMLGSSHFAGAGDLGELSVNEEINLGVEVALASSKITGSGTFAKSGPGVFYADLVEGPSLDVRSGTLIVHSESTPTTYDELPANYFLHLDAANLSSLDLVTKSATYNDGYEPLSGVTTNMVAHWYDARHGNDGVHLYGTSRKSDGRYQAGVLVEDGLNGLPVVDYGPSLTFLTGMSPARRRFHEIHMNEENVVVNANPVRSIFMVKNAAFGGNQVMGDMTGEGIARTGDLTDPSTPITSASCFAATLNGQDLDPTVVGYTGGWDLLAMHTMKPVSAGLLGCGARMTSSGSITGGMMLGEVLIFTNTISVADSHKIEAYLGRKWFGRTMPLGSPSAAGRVSVASGATLRVEGDAPLAATSVSGQGVIDGSVTLVSDAVLEVVVKDDGSIASATVISGKLDASAGGTVIVTGAVKALKKGIYPILTATSLVSGVWSCLADGIGRPVKVVVQDNALCLCVGQNGLVLMVR